MTTKWEYKFITGTPNEVTLKDRTNGIDEQLKLCGEDGWEAYAVIKLNYGAGVEIYLKRILLKS